MCGPNRRAADVSHAQLLQNSCCQCRGVAEISNPLKLSRQLLTQLSIEAENAPLQASADARQSLGLVGQQGRGGRRHDVHVPPCCRRAQVGAPFAAVQHQARHCLHPPQCGLTGAAATRCGLSLRCRGSADCEDEEANGRLLLSLENHAIKLWLCSGHRFSCAAQA